VGHASAHAGVTEHGGHDLRHGAGRRGPSERPAGGVGDLAAPRVGRHLRGLPLDSTGVMAAYSDDLPGLLVAGNTQEEIARKLSPRRAPPARSSLRQHHRPGSFRWNTQDQQDIRIGQRERQSIVEARRRVRNSDDGASTLRLARKKPRAMLAGVSDRFCCVDDDCPGFTAGAFFASSHVAVDSAQVDGRSSHAADRGSALPRRGRPAARNTAPGLAQVMKRREAWCGYPRALPRAVRLPL
jgi:hypothetical protein